MIKEQEAGLPISELCRKHGLRAATFYKLKAKYGGMELSDVSLGTDWEEPKMQSKTHA